MPAGLDHSKRNDKSCQKSCSPCQDAGSVVLAIVHPRPSLHRGHHTCLFKVQVWLSPSCSGTCLTFPLETKKFVFQENWGTKEALQQDGLIICFCQLWMFLRGWCLTRSTWWVPVPWCPEVLPAAGGLAPAPHLPPACLGFFPREVKAQAKKKYCGLISSWCKFGVQLGFVCFWHRQCMKLATNDNLLSARIVSGKINCVVRWIKLF